MRFSFENLDVYQKARVLVKDIQDAVWLEKLSKQTNR